VNTSSLDVLLTRDVGEALLERIRWWVDYTAMFGQRIDINPSVGNKKGGLTTIYEKSLGAIAKRRHISVASGLPIRRSDR